MYVCMRPALHKDDYNQYLFGVRGQHLVHLLVREYSNVMLYSGTRAPAHRRCVSHIRVQRCPEMQIRKG